MRRKDCLGNFIKSFFLFWLFIPQILLSQIDTTLKDYFPMHIGDYWEYLALYTPPQPSVRSWMKVAGDSLMPNGKTYRIFVDGVLDPPGITQRDSFYFRIDDSLRVWRYRGIWVECQDSGEIVWYDLKARDSTFWSACYLYSGRGLTLTDTESYAALNLTLETKQFVFVEIDIMQHDTIWGPVDLGMDYLAKKIGVVKSVGGGSVSNIQGAIINGVQYGQVNSVKDYATSRRIPDRFSLSQNYPNPFNPSTTIEYDLARRTNVHLSVFDLLGKKIATLVDEAQEPGTHRINFNASNLSSGLYYYELSAGEYHFHKKMALVR